MSLETDENAMSAKADYYEFIQLAELAGISMHPNITKIILEMVRLGVDPDILFKIIEHVGQVNDRKKLRSKTARSHRAKQ